MESGRVAGLPQGFHMSCLGNSIKNQVLEPEFSLVVGYFFLFEVDSKFLIQEIQYL